MNSEYLGSCHFRSALAYQDELHARVVSDFGQATLLGFEPLHPVVTLGKRATAQDRAHESTFDVFELDRGGQATIHNPGQLVVFPIAPVLSVRSWIDLLWNATRATTEYFGKKSLWNPACPGLYTGDGKIASLGVRVRSGVSTHGMALNVSNRLEDFRAIRTCGVSSAPMDRLGADIPVEAVFQIWVENFKHHADRQLTSTEILPTLGGSR